MLDCVTDFNVCTERDSRKSKYEVAPFNPRQAVVVEPRLVRPWVNYVLEVIKERGKGQMPHAHDALESV